MALPIVVTYNLAAAVSTALVNALGTTGPGALTLSTTILDKQRRLLITAAGDESSNTFTVVGTNSAGFAVSEVITGPNASTTQSNIDFKTVSTITALATTAGTLSVGTNGVGSTLWNIMNYHVTPVNMEVACVLQTGAATYSVQYTYDDPNNLPSGVNFPQPFNHPTLVTQTTSLDGSINDPVVGVRLLVNGGTGTVRMTILQAGISGP